ncbi:50S ribosomal protein L23 [Candidatus Daviesbacteria bacterium]|nr:50S ribosomal protein L23 [Candidatus Daviesbacteria bacterium]
MIVLIRPIISEKSMKLAGVGQYTFTVAKNATKLQIAKAVKEQFNVDVVRVSSINIKGENKMQKRMKKFYQTSGFKKAIVQIAKDQKIAIFEAPKEEAMVVAAEGEPQVIKERKDILRRTKVKVERGAGAAPMTQRKVITGK